MPFINYENREISFKIVYYGPGMSGKTSNIIFVHKTIAEDKRGELISLKTSEERTLFFDFFPLELGHIATFSVRFNMYTLPGQIYYEASRRLILDGADGVVFVADSQRSRYERNILHYQLLEKNLMLYKINPKAFPIVLQYNKRDCDTPIEIGTIEKQLGLEDVPVFEAVATRGDGVLETIRELSRRVISQFEV
ncbi:MAG: GTPase domain-containing protein [Deltaproteobacteria bacterium]|nr:GTPase domain-containing protein [Deltaproteobacteria bacterium]